MAWDATKPADTGAILTQLSGLRANWTAIDNALDMADSGCYRLKLLETTDPVAEANTGFAYVKDDSGDTELYYRDDSGNIVQMTKDGYNPGFVKAFVYFNSSGTVQGTAYNVASVVKDATGTYTITFTTAISSANYAVAFGISADCAITILSQAVGSMQIRARNVNTSIMDAACSVTVFHV